MPSSEPPDLPTYILLGDQPYTAEEDPLGFDQIAGELSELILRARASSPFTLGIEGGWGTGKSTLMQKVEQRLGGRDDVRTVRFNAWSVEKGDALEGLIKSVLAQLGSRQLARAAHRRQLLGGVKILATVAGGYLGVGGLVDSIWNALAVDPKARTDLQAVMKEAMDAWRSKRPAVEGGRLLVVFIDDLDRCSPTNVFQVFEAIKLHLNTEGLVFVIGFDGEIVSSAVLTAERYAESTKGIDYLEKIIQTSYRMPLPSEQSSDGLLNAYLSESGTKQIFSESTLASLVIERNARNPRRMKRFINAFILEWGLDPEWSERFDPAVVARVVILNLYFSDFAKLLYAAKLDDPIGSFRRYHAFRKVLESPLPARDDTDAWDNIAELVRYFLGSAETPAEPASVLGKIEEKVPPCFPELAEDDDFAEMLIGFGDKDARAHLCEKLQRKRPVTAEEDSPAAKGFQPLPAPTGEPPYRLELGEVLPKEELAEIEKHGEITFQATGDVGGIQNPEPQMAVAAAMSADPAAPATSFLYLLGDLVYFDGAAEGYPSQFYAPYAGYPAPIFAIPGNHDGQAPEDGTTPSLAAFTANFCAAEAHRTPEAGDVDRDAMTQPNVYWTLAAPFVTVVGLYTNVPAGGMIDGEQAAWLAGELVDAPADRALIVAVHHPPYSVDAHHGGSQRMGTILDDAFARAGRLPELVLSAHVNNYQRFTRTVEEKGVPYVIAGAGGYHHLHRISPTASVGMRLDDELSLDAFCDDRFGYLRIQASATSLRGEYVGLDPGQPEEQAKVLDSFAVPLAEDAAR